MNFGNLHALAATVIPQQAIQLERFKGNVTNAAGYTVPEYYDPETITGSIQPVEAKDTQTLGLDMRQVNKTLHTSAEIKLAGAGTQPDRILYVGRTYEPIGITDWQAEDGWAYYILVAV